MQPRVLALAAHYFLEAKTSGKRPPDPVARFHLGNGARLERINWRGDISQKGLREAHGVMVNYLYEIKEIEKNHENYADSGAVTASRAVRGLLRPLDKSRSTSIASPALPPPGANAPRRHRPRWTAARRPSRPLHRHRHLSSPAAANPDNMGKLSVELCSCFQAGQCAELGSKWAARCSLQPRMAAACCLAAQRVEVST